MFNRKKKKEQNFDDFPAIGGVMVSKKITNEGELPMFIYREKRTRKEDSGWRIFSGTESDDYINDPENAGIYNPSTILKIDSSIKDLLLEGVGSVFEREDANSDWYRVSDFKLEDDYTVEHRIAGNWTIKINNLFERTIEDDGDLLYTTGDKSIRIAVWNFETQSQKEIYEEEKEKIANRDQSESKTLKTYELSDDVTSRLGFKIKEGDESKSYEVVYGRSIVNASLIQLAFYFDYEEDEEWAIETWKQIKPE